MTLESLIFIAVAGCALGYSAFRFKILYQMLLAHQGEAPKFGDTSKRVIETLSNVLGQKAVLKKPAAGIMHAAIFWGFLVITIGTIEQFLTTLYAPLHFEVFGQFLYGGFLWLQDFFVTLVLIAVAYAFYRRLILRPKHLSLTSDALWILVFTGSLMASILLMNAFMIIGDNPWYASSMPVSSGVARLISFSPLGAQDVAVYLGYSKAFKWIHMILVLGFAAYIPHSKHLHVVAAGPNTFLKNLDRAKPMRPINFEDESLEQYGSAKITDLSWKDALDYYSCTECGRCQELCPAWNTDKPLSPKKIIHDLKMNLYANQKAVLAKKYDEVGPVIDDQVTQDVIWACTSCRACEVACPVFIQQTDKIYDIRRNLVMMESSFPTEVQTVFKNMETNATPWAFSADDRDQWAKDLEIPSMNEISSAADLDVLLWVGCAGSYDDRNKKVLRAFVNVLKKANVKFAILGKEEQCTGDPARRIGNEYLFQSLAQANVETLNRYQVKTIVTACPHCFNTLKNEYKDFGGEYEVIHHSQYLLKLIRGGQIKPTQAKKEKVTFHDSCYLGRWNGEYNAPRSVLSSVPDTELVEMKSTGDKSLCCGAGGGRMWMEETIGERINIKRSEEALATNASVVATSCPFCMTMLTDGLKAKEKQDLVQVQDLAELIEESLV